MHASQAILAIETSGKSGSVAILRNDRSQVVCNMIQLAPDLGSAKTLAPGIQRLLSEQHVEIGSLSAIALLTGPGSFTGLRVGVATAKAMAYALKIPTIEIDTLDAIALQCPVYSDSVYAILDAYRGQVFCAEYTTGGATPNSRLKRFSQTEILDIEVLLARTKNGGDPNGIIDLCGPGCDRIRKFLATSNDGQSALGLDFAKQIRWIDGEVVVPHAESVARLGYVKWLAGEVLDPFVLQPQYYRVSAAEEVAARTK